MAMEVLLEEQEAAPPMWHLRSTSTHNFSFVKTSFSQAAANPWDLSGLDPMAGSAGPTGARPKTGVESLLGEHSNLVNLDNLTQVTRLLFGSRNLAHLFQAALRFLYTITRLLSWKPNADPFPLNRRRQWQP